MVRDYVRKSTGQSWDEETMKTTVETVVRGQGVSATARDFGLPRSTLQLKVKELKENSIAILKKSMGFHTVFTAEQELELTNYILKMERSLMGLSSYELKSLAYQLAVKLNVRHNFNSVKGVAGKDWMRGFMKRNKLSLRKPTSAARANAWNPEARVEFFILLTEVMEKYNFDPSRIYNVDETGITCNPKTARTVVAQKGRKQVSGLSSAERGETVTADICFSASGKYMPPMLIFPRVRENITFLRGAPPSSWAEFHKSGYMQFDIFTRWFKRFIEFSHASKSNPVLLLLDGRSTHVKNINVIDLALENGVVILCFPMYYTESMYVCITLNKYQYGYEKTNLKL